MKNLTLVLAALSLSFFACATPGECGSDCAKPSCDATAKAECGSECAKPSCDATAKAECGSDCTKPCCGEKQAAQCCKDAKALGKECADCAK
ncbi:MAG: hypothetical protein QGH51_04040 [Planctomycetota bacterium]|nr:hypothetical protein [Planctomycetota bacterium]